MSYPKPLSEKSLKRLYSESGLSDRTQEFLHTLFAACANLYGAIDLRNVWQICQQLQVTPKPKRKDLLAFSSIVRRENQPYCVFEVEELYECEPHNELDRCIVNREIVGSGYGKFSMVYDLIDQAIMHPYCVAADFLSYANPSVTAEEAALRSFLSNLVSVADKCAPKHGEAIENENKGKKLGEFSFLNASERFEAEWLKKQPSALASFMEDVSGSEAEKIVRFYKRAENIGRTGPADALQYVMDELNEVGVELNEGQLKTLISLINNYHNNSRLWCTAGWKPSELSAMYPGGPKAVSFGPGFQRAFSDGSIDKAELVKKIREMGIEVIE